jgi:MFS family permease
VSDVPMNPTVVERRLIDAFAAARREVHVQHDLFARVNRSLADAAERRQWRRRLAAGLMAFGASVTALALALSDFDNGRITMDWWVIELITNIVLVAIAIGLGPFIKRFGRAYAADVFRANPRTGKSYLVLTDVAYYLIFTSFMLFTVTFVASDDWRASTGDQLKDEVTRVGGILLIMGVLHALNVVALPVIGRLLSLNKRLDDDDHRHPAPSATHSVGAPPLGPGTWIVRVEPSPGDHPPA